MLYPIKQFPEKMPSAAQTRFWRLTSLLSLLCLIAWFLLGVQLLPRSKATNLQNGIEIKAELYPDLSHNQGDSKCGHMPR